MARKKAETNATNNTTKKTTKKKTEEKKLIRGVTYDDPDSSVPLDKFGFIDPVTKDYGDDEDTLEYFYDPHKVQLALDGLAIISKDVKSSMGTVNDKQIRIIIDSYYQTQEARIALQNQVRSVEQGFDEANNEEQPAIRWLLQDYINRENQIKKMIAEYVNHVPVCRWAMSVIGIGPVFAANLWSYINMDECKHANQFLNYAGLNDNNIPWLGTEKADKIVNNIYDELGMKKSDPVTDEVLIKVAEASGRKFSTVLKGFTNHKERNKNGKGKKETDRTILSKYLAKPPYNTDLKKMCYLIGQSFCKVSNKDGSLYGKLYRERKAWETMRNDNLEYKDQCDRLLKEKNYSKETDTYKYLSQGKLSPAHINQRAQRFATKIFLTHFFEACWVYTHGTKPPVIYPIAFQDHVDYIKPENPYEDYI